MSDIDALVETVREGIDSDSGDYTTQDIGHAALSELAALARKFNAMDSRYHELWHEETDRAEAAEAERDRLKDALRANRETTFENDWFEAQAIARAALADVGGRMSDDARVDALVETVRNGLRLRGMQWTVDYDRTERAHAALDAFANERDRMIAVLDRVINAGVETWHTVVNDEPQLSAWLGLTDEEYGAWVEGGADRLARAALADVGGTEENTG